MVFCVKLCKTEYIEERAAQRIPMLRVWYVPLEEANEDRCTLLLI